MKNELKQSIGRKKIKFFFTVSFQLFVYFLRCLFVQRASEFFVFVLHMGGLSSKQRPLDVIDMKQAAQTLKTGDLLLFAGVGWISCEIRCATFSKYSHVGLIIKTDAFKKRVKRLVDGTEQIVEVDVDANQLYMLHSIDGAINGIKDILTNKVRSGVQINSLTKCMRRCTAQVHFRQLILKKEGPYIYEQEIRTFSPKKEKQRTASQLRNRDFNLNAKDSKLSYFLQRVKGMPYEMKLMEMAEATMFCMSHPEDTKDSFFCSELVADFYKTFGILPQNANASEYIPKDFAIMCDNDHEYEATYPYGSSQPSIAVSNSRFGVIRCLTNGTF